MIGTPQGDFEPGNSPFAKREWTWGMAGIGVDVPRSGNSLVINNLSGSKVTTESFTNSGPPLTVGSYLTINPVTGQVTWIGPTPQPTPTTAPPTTMPPTTVPPTTAPPTTMPPTTVPPTTMGPTTAPPTTPPP